MHHEIDFHLQSSHICHLAFAQTIRAWNKYCKRLAGSPASIPDQMTSPRIII